MITPLLLCPSGMFVNSINLIRDNGPALHAFL